MANKSHAAAPGPTERRHRRPASVSIRQRTVTGRVADPASGGPQAKALEVASTARKSEARDKNRRAELRGLRTSGSAAPGELVQRLIDTGLRLHALRDSDALYKSLIDEAAHFSGAQRVLLVLSGPDGLRIAGSLLPQGEDAKTLLHAVTPWLSESSRTRTVSLRHGPEGADPIYQRSCLIAPLLARHELLGYLYADIEGAVGRFDDADRDLLRMLALQAAAALVSIRFGEGLERKVDERTAELTEALEYQSAISQVLRVISESPLDVAPVFEAILESATRLFGEPLAAVFRFDSKLVHLVATRNWPTAAVVDARRLYPAPPNPKMMSGRVILSGRVKVEEDTFLDPDYDQTALHRLAPHARRPAAQGRHPDRRHRGCLAASGSHAAAPDRPAQDLRRSGGHRDRERAAAQRDEGSAGAADRDRRGVASHQQIGVRRTAGLRKDYPKLPAPVQWRAGRNPSGAA